jgi:hypothetical protein
MRQRARAPHRAGDVVSDIGQKRKAAIDSNVVFCCMMSLTKPLLNGSSSVAPFSFCIVIQISWMRAGST